MKTWLRYYYYKYLFPADPTNAWLRHTFKSMLVIGLCVLATWIRRPFQLADVWLIFTGFMTMFLTNISLPLDVRLKKIVEMSLTGFIVANLMMCLSGSEVARIGVLVFCVFVGTYISNKKPDYAQSAVLAMIYSLIALAYPLNSSEWIRLDSNFAIMLGICCGVLYFVWPDRLMRQIALHQDTGFLLMGRYLCFVLSDSSIGNIAENRRILLKENLIDNQLILSKLEQAYYKTAKDDLLRTKVNQHRDLIYHAIAIESSLQNLSNRAYFNGPNQSIQACVKAYQQLFQHVSHQQKHDRDTQDIQAAFQQFKEHIAEQQTMIKQKVSLIYHDFLQWNDVVFKMERFNHALFQLLDHASEE